MDKKSVKGKAENITLQERIFVTKISCDVFFSYMIYLVKLRTKEGVKNPLDSSKPTYFE